MPIRTVQILGQGYGSTPVQLTVTANANTVFSGTVNTIDQPLPVLPILTPDAPLLTNVLCSFEIDTAFVGEIPMTCVVSTGAVIFAQIFYNYVTIPNPVYTAKQRFELNYPATTQADRVAIYTQVAVPALSQSDIDVLLDPTSTPEQCEIILVAHNCTVNIPSGPDIFAQENTLDPRSEVSIDGILQTIDRGTLIGTWWWPIYAGSTLSYQLTVDSATI
jgi:hypothetical protein